LAELLCRCSVVVVVLCVEATYGEQVEHLLVGLLLGVEQTMYHLFCIVRQCRHVEVERHLRALRRAGDVHQAVHSHVVVRERVADVQVGKAHAVHDVECAQIERGVIRVASERYRATAEELEVFLDDVLYSQFVGSVVNIVVAVEVEGALIEIRST
jgi:hypothetical protein